MSVKKSKKYKESLKAVDQTKLYSLKEAVEKLKSFPKLKFDESVDVSITLDLDKGQKVRAVIMFPHTFGAPKKVVVIAKGEKAEEAKKAGADFIGDSDLIEKISKGWFEFDTVISTPDMMKDLSKLGPTLGRRGLMPNPKTGTVTMDIKKAVEDSKKGRIEYKTDKEGVIGLCIGKISMDTEKIIDNINELYHSVHKNKPKDQKGEYMVNLVLSKTMSPGIKVDFKNIVTS